MTERILLDYEIRIEYRRKIKKKKKNNDNNENRLKTFSEGFSDAVI